jgi:hypothetical protein
MKVFFISSQKELPSINNDKINEKKEEDISLPPIKGLILQQKVVKPVYKAKNLKVGSINHKNARAKVDDKNNFSKSRKNEAKIKENIKEVQVMSSINPEKSTTKKEEIEHKENNDIQNKKSSVSIEDEIVIETEEQKEEMKIVNAYINKLDDIKVDEEYHLQTETHHEIKRDRNFLNDFILLDQIESYKSSNEMINQHVWSIDTFINNNHAEKLLKSEALKMLWNIYAKLILNNEHNKPILSFQTIEMIKGRLQKLTNTKEDIKEKTLDLLPSIIKFIPEEELVKLRGVLGHLYRFCRAFNNDISNNLSVIFSPLILVKLNNFIPSPESIVNFPEKSPSFIQINDEYDKERILFKEQIRSAARKIEQEKSKGVGKKRLYEKIFYDSNPINIGDFILRNMIIYYRQLFLDY